MTPLENAHSVHQAAMELAEDAFLAERRGDHATAVKLHRRAFLLEAEAADALGDSIDVEPTRSILYRSAATLALRCGELRETKRLVTKGLAGEPPEEIADELRAVLEEADKSERSSGGNNKNVSLDTDHALTILNRLASRKPDQRMRLEEALRGRLDSLAEISMRVATETGDPMGLVLADILRRDPNPVLASRMDKEMPDSSVVLRELGLLAAQQILDSLSNGSSGGGEDHLAAVARWSNTLAARLDALNQPEQALAPLEEAVRLYRQLGEDHRHDLAMALTNHAILLNQLGQYRTALPVAEEAVALRRSMSILDPQDPMLPNVAHSLEALWVVMEGLGRLEEALQAIQEAVQIYRALAQVDPADPFKPDRASALRSLSNCLHRFERHEEALRAIEEVVSLCFDLQEGYPDAFLPRFAEALLLYSNRLSDLGRHETALRIAQIAVDTYRSMAEPAHQRQVFLPILAKSLNNLANRLSYLDRFEEALSVSEEAAGYYEGLSKDHPDVFGAEYAVSLNTLARRLANVRRTQDASTKAWEAVDKLSLLFLQQPPAYADWMRLVRQDYVNFAQAAGTVPDWDRLSTIDAALERLQKQALEPSAKRVKLPCLPQRFIASLYVAGGATTDIERLVQPTRSLIRFLGYVQEGDFAVSEFPSVKRGCFFLSNDIEEEVVRWKAQLVETVISRFTQVELDPEARDCVQEVTAALGDLTSGAVVDAGLFAFIKDPEGKPFFQILAKRLTQEDRERLDRDPTGLQPKPGARFRP